MSYNNILTSLEDSILTISINRESKLNALTIETLREIKHAVDEAQTNDEVHGMILTGVGEKAFAAGADISEFAHFNIEQATRMSADGHDVMNSIENGNKVVIAAVNGFSLGGGCELAMACHLRVASTQAKFGQPEVNLGVPPGYGGTQRLVQLVGKGIAMELLLTGDAIDAQTALNLGLVNRVVEPAELMSETRSLLKKICGKSPSAVNKVIKCVNDYFRPNVNGMQREIYEFGEAFETPDFQEGTDAFLNKRKPNFRG
jgi:enoyl-CoA hydratase